MRRQFSKEYREEAVKLVLEQGLSVAQTAADLGIGKSTLDRWVQVFKQRKADPNALTESEQEELKRLRKEVSVLKMERDLLKKTAVYFAKTSTPGAS